MARIKFYFGELDEKFMIWNKLIQGKDTLNRTCRSILENWGYHQSSHWDENSSVVERGKKEIIMGILNIWEDRTPEEGVINFFGSLKAQRDWIFACIDITGDISRLLFSAVSALNGVTSSFYSSKINLVEFQLE